MKNMKILVVDRDPVTLNLVMARAKESNHEVIGEPDKGRAVSLIEEEKVDLVMIDTAPMTNTRSILQNFRHKASNYFYMTLMTHDLNQEEAIRAGANDVLTKPIGSENMMTMIDNAHCFLNLMQQMGDDSEDFPSAGGVISKSAFNQLFLSATDRTSRYGERGNILMIGIDNYEAIATTEGLYAADKTSAELSKVLVSIRRQSDVLAQTGKGEYSILLQRPQYENEPMQAAKRFYKTLFNKKNIFRQGDIEPMICVRLLELPVGDITYKRFISDVCEE